MSEADEWKAKWHDNCLIADAAYARAEQAEAELELTIRARDALAAAVEKAEADLAAADAIWNRRDAEQVAALDAARAEIERLNRCWEESRASAADAGLALRELRSGIPARTLIDEVFDHAAVLTERRRCATIAREAGRELAEAEGYTGPWSALAEKIAAAIEEGSQP